MDKRKTGAVKYKQLQKTGRERGKKKQKTKQQQRFTSDFTPHPPHSLPLHLNVSSAAVSRGPALSTCQTGRAVDSQNGSS